MSVGDMYSSSTKVVAGAHGEEGPTGDPIADESGNGDTPSQLQPNEAIRVTPKPDAQLQADDTSDPDAQWTGTRPGGEAPPPTADVH